MHLRHDHNYLHTYKYADLPAAPTEVISQYEAFWKLAKQNNPSLENFAIYEQIQIAM